MLAKRHLRAPLALLFSLALLVLAACGQTVTIKRPAAVATQTVQPSATAAAGSGSSGTSSGSSGDTSGSSGGSSGSSGGSSGSSGGSSGVSSPPTNTPVPPPTNTPVPTPTNTPNPCPTTRDDFNGPTPQPYWTFTGGSGSSYSFANSSLFGSSVVTFNAPANADLYASNNYNAPRFLQPTNSSSFTISTRVTYFGVTNITYTGSGLLVWQDANNFARLEYAIWGSNNTPGIEFDVMDGGTYHRVVNAATTPFSTGAFNPVYLTLFDTGSYVGAMWSLDGKTYNFSPKYTKVFGTAPKVGIDVVNVTDGPRSGIFDFFTYNPCVF